MGKEGESKAIELEEAMKLALLVNICKMMLWRTGAYDNA